MTAPNEIVARRLLKQAEWCERMGSRLYSTLLREAASDVRAGGVCCAVLHDHHDDPPDSALGLRFLGAVHRLVLQKKAPHLAACYPSAGGDSRCDELWPAFQAVVRQHTEILRELVRRPVQTNEVGRCAALLGGFLEVVRRTGLPLRLLEVGAAGGLILRWDHYRYEAGDEGWGDRGSPVRICGAFADVHPSFDVAVKITERRGCDASPIDLCTEEGQLTLQSYMWPDQVERFRQLAAAIELARRVPAQVEQANAADWVESAVAHGISGVATVVYHSIVWQYLSNGDRARFKRVMAEAGQAATHDSPLAWLRFEPAGDVAEVRLQFWPGSEDRLLAQSGFHGKPVQWLGRGH
ncbi:MAG TPA: DUF2332 domain-containing protein [Candidatus Angelobacter sp.]|nr:DUF2332 domain-containing protein [Candidatus Angelobacter sp.]